MILTEEQIDRMVELSAPLVSSPLPWSALTQDQREVFQLLMPRPFFRDDQHYYLGLWLLAVSQTQVDQMNAVLPAHIAVFPLRSLSGDLWLRADLLSDALYDGPLSDLLPWIELLPLTYAQTVAFPADPEA